MVSYGHKLYIYTILLYVLAVKGRYRPWLWKSAICANWEMTNCSKPSLKNCLIIITTAISSTVHVCSCAYVCDMPCWFVFTSHLIYCVIDSLYDQWHLSLGRYVKTTHTHTHTHSLSLCFSPPVHRFSVNVEPGTKLESGPASLHLCNNLLVLTKGIPPVVIGHWKLSALRRYGAVPNGFVFEGGTRCGYCE